MANDEVEGRKLYYSTLLELGACTDYRDRFRDLFGKGDVFVTVELAVAQALQWDWYWAAEYLLTVTGSLAWKQASDLAQQEYMEIMLPAWKATDAARFQAAEAREAARLAHSDPESEEAWEIGEGIGAQAMRAAYAAEDAVAGPATAKAQAALARKFAEIFIAEGRNAGE